MKTSNVIASLFFGSLAAAVPFKRDLYTKTELVVETVVVFTTVWNDGLAPTVATTTARAFYEQPSKASSSAAKITSTSAYVAPVVASSTNVYIAPTTTYVYTPAAVPTSALPSLVYTPSSSVSSAAASASSSPSTGGTGSGETHSGGDITIYYTGSKAGMCSKGNDVLSDSALTVSIGAGLIGTRQTDYMTGDAVNELCGKKMAITYQGTTIEATIMDLCAGCVGNDVDLTPAAYRALTGLQTDERLRGAASWKIVG